MNIWIYRNTVIFTHKLEKVCLLKKSIPQGLKKSFCNFYFTPSPCVKQISAEKGLK